MCVLLITNIYNNNKFNYVITSLIIFIYPISSVLALCIKY